MRRFKCINWSPHLTMQLSPVLLHTKKSLLLLSCLEFASTSAKRAKTQLKGTLVCDLSISIEQIVHLDTFFSPNDSINKVLGVLDEVHHHCTDLNMMIEYLLKDRVIYFPCREDLKKAFDKRKLLESLIESLYRIETRTDSLLQSEGIEFQADLLVKLQLLRHQMQRARSTPRM